MRQTDLFGEITEELLSIEDVASMLDVSSASVRNWVKTKYLTNYHDNLITKESFEKFQKTVVGSEKLTLRANKSQKDLHDHKKVERQIRGLLSDDLFDPEELGETYEKSLSNSYQNKEGIYYTPKEIVNRFFECLPNDCSNLAFCDPCCGSGNFIIAAIEFGFNPENIYGYDIDPIAVEITKKRVEHISGHKSKNIFCSDYIEDEYLKNKNSFDVIFTNPPWGKKIEKSRKESLSKQLHSGLSKDTSALFFAACIENLKQNGYLGLLLQEAFF